MLQHACLTRNETDVQLANAQSGGSALIPSHAWTPVKAIVIHRQEGCTVSAMSAQKAQSVAHTAEEAIDGRTCSSIKPSGALSLSTYIADCALNTV